MKKVSVHIEWPTGSKTVVIEVADDASEDDIREEAQDAFFNECNYGYEVIDNAIARSKPE